MRTSGIPGGTWTSSAVLTKAGKAQGSPGLGHSASQRGRGRPDIRALVAKAVTSGSCAEPPCQPKIIPEQKFQKTIPKY